MEKRWWALLGISGAQAAAMLLIAGLLVGVFVTINEEIAGARPLPKLITSDPAVVVDPLEINVTIGNLSASQYCGQAWCLRGEVHFDQGPGNVTIATLDLTFYSTGFSDTWLRNVTLNVISEGGSGDVIVTLRFPLIKFPAADRKWMHLQQEL